MIGAFVSNERELHELKYAINLVAKLSYIEDVTMRSLVLEGYKQAVDQALEDHLLTVEEERCLEAIEASFGLTADELEEHWRINENIARSHNPAHQRRQAV